MKRQETEARYAYLSSLASDLRFKAHVVSWLEQIKREHTLKATSLSSTMEQVRFSQGALEVIRLFEGLLSNAKRQLETKEDK